MRVRRLRGTGVLTVLPSYSTFNDGKSMYSDGLMGEASTIQRARMWPQRLGGRPQAPRVGPDVSSSRTVSAGLLTLVPLSLAPQ